MFTYKCEIKSGPLLEVKYYKSFRRRNKKNLARQINQSRTNEKQAKANRIRGEQHTQRLILCNFSEGDWFARFSAPFGEFTEDEFERVVSNFSSVSNAGQIKNKLNLSTSGTANVANSVETGICTS